MPQSRWTLDLPPSGETAPHDRAMTTYHSKASPNPCPLPVGNQDEREREKCRSKRSPQHHEEVAWSRRCDDDCDHYTGQDRKETVTNQPHVWRLVASPDVHQVDNPESTVRLEFYEDSERANRVLGL